MRARLLVSVLMVLTAGCGRAPQPSQADLEALLVQDGDLPAGVVASQVRDSPPVPIEGLPTAAQTVYREFGPAESPLGDVIVWRYTLQADVEQGYEAIAGQMEGQAPAEAIGERAEVSVGTVAASAVSSVVFARCNTVASIVMYNSDLEAVQTYAKRLDQRLQAVVC